MLTIYNAKDHTIRLTHTLADQKNQRLQLLLCIPESHNTTIQNSLIDEQRWLDQGLKSKRRLYSNQLSLGHICAKLSLLQFRVTKEPSYSIQTDLYLLLMQFEQALHRQSTEIKITCRIQILEQLCLNKSLPI